MSKGKKTCPNCQSFQTEPLIFGIPLPLGLADLVKGTFGEVEWKCQDCHFEWKEKGPSRNG